MKKYGKFLLFFLFFLFIIIFNLLFVINNLDEIWNYGFSYAIRLGEIPYKDFNMVIPPLYSFIMTIPLLISNSYLSFIIFHALIVTLEFYLLYKMFDKKIYFLIIISLMFFPLIYPTYNFFFLFLMILIIYFEKSNIKYKDYLIGFLVACCILTKHSVGIFFIIPSILFIKKSNISLVKRIIGFIIPNIIFLIYLLLTGTLYDFLDLCLFGMFDFTNNSNGFGLAVFLFLILVIVSVIIIAKNKNDISNYYLIFSYLLFVPLFDNLHLFYVIFSFTILFINIVGNIRLRYELIFYPCLIAIIFTFGKAMNVLEYQKNNLKHFEYKNISRKNVMHSNEIVSFIKDNASIIYNDDAYFYRIAANQKIDFLDLVNHGNHGYNGSKKIIKLIEKNNDKIFLIKKDCYKRIANKETQLDKEGFEYIIKNGKKIDTLLDYDLCVLK